MSLFNRNDKSDDAAKSPAPVTPSKPQTSPPAAPQKSESAMAPSSPAVTKPTAIPTATSAKTGVPMASVISKALKITGQLESTEDIQIDGQIEGDVRGVGVKIGQNAKVKGSVYGEEVELAGSIDGKIESKKVILTATARMTGDVVHQEIKIESGAYISGNLKPDLGKSASRPDIKPVPAVSSAPVNTPAPALAAKN